MALHIIRHVEGMQSVHADQQNVFDVAVGRGRAIPAKSRIAVASVGSKRREITGEFLLISNEKCLMRVTAAS